ncbi:hypothetical protein Sme01_35320 [Sphaerisporangium melleum]|uniref:ATPase AAA-type core domain-containing protein n=1 Tax=Sphaerisporangium melleum TaxID=321316 RepID=A0A917VLS2_9ACTN|nr:AAA family ATPase [Sphaerisporangium melleum]GGK96988.1 hypothetical protein GCM10007964_43980 [Sphaerisporangium melleum]GII71056.1 hypothetical protein Sme01_35320 [Sphaerisporangium melleum]
MSTAVPAGSRERGITRISVEGYKSLRQPQSIAIKPLTIIAGVNSAGKSSIIQPLLLLKQTMEAPYDPGPLQLDGPNVSITKIEQVLSRGPMPSEKFSVGIMVGDKETRLTFGKDPEGDIRVLEVSGWFVPEQQAPVTLTEHMTHAEIANVLPAATTGRGEENPLDIRRFGGELAVIRDRSFLTLAVVLDRETDELVLNLPRTSPALLESAALRIIHLPALRGNPRRTYRTTAIDGRYPGTFEAYTAGMVAAWQARDAKEKIRGLQRDLEELGLTWTVEARRLDDTQVELLVGRLPRVTRDGHLDVVNIADVGFGVSQTLPVVVALLAAESDQLVYLEQPEIHLHPRAQVAFAQLVKRAVMRGVRVIIETHSAMFVRAVQTLVALHEIDQDDVVLHWFSRDSETGYTTVASAELDQAGSFGDWPEDFDEVLLDVESRYLDAAGGGAE